MRRNYMRVSMGFTDKRIMALIFTDKQIMKTNFTD